MDIKIILSPLHRYVDPQWGSESDIAINIVKALLDCKVDFYCIVGEFKDFNYTFKELKLLPQAVELIGSGRDMTLRNDLKFYFGLYKKMKNVANLSQVKGRQYIYHHVMPMGYRAGFNPMAILGKLNKFVIGPLFYPISDHRGEDKIDKQEGRRTSLIRNAFTGSIGNRLFLKTLEIADVILCDSEDTKELVSEDYPYETDGKLAVLNTIAADESLFYPKESAIGTKESGNKVITIGTISYARPQKNLDKLITSLTYLDRQMVRLELLDYGDPDTLANLKKLVKDLGLSETVRFRERKPHKAMPDVIRSYDIYCSLVKAPHVCFQSVAEALMSGVPIITGTQREDVSIKRMPYGFVVNPTRPELIADAINSFITNPELLTIMGAQARNHALDNHSIRSLGFRLKALYEGI